MHSWVVRLTHWVNVAAMACMMMSGWVIYNASPLFAFRFPGWAGLGGWLGGAIAWHLAVAWLLVGNAAVYVLHGVATRHFRVKLAAPSPGEVLRDARAAARFELVHHGHAYNAVQRAAYLGVLALALGVVISGLALWKPVQFQTLTGLLGGYEAARRVHFVCMAGIAAFVVVHVAMVIAVPRSLVAMVLGRGR